MENEEKTSGGVIKSRLDSLDALRGFDMFWIMGGEGIVHTLAQLTGWSVLVMMSTQLEHVEWNGFHFYDMIFPLFLFIAGVSMPFSLSKRMEREKSRKKIYFHIIKRMLILVFLGMIYNGLLEFDWEKMRYASVLARIGLGWFFAALIFINTTRKSQYYWFGGILVLYWLMLSVIPVPGIGAGVLTKEGSLVGYVDRLLLPGRLYLGIHDPEGILSTFPAIATALLGVLTGHFLKDNNPVYTPLKKGLYIALAGLSCLVAGNTWGLFLPVNKNLWTSSFVLVAGGWSLILLSVFYLIMDVWNRKKWAFFFVVIGLNPITIYLCQRGVLSFRRTNEFFFGGLVKYFPANWHDFLIAVGYVAVSWIFLYLLYRKRIFLRV
jgi:predicted acyltransferase